MLVARFLRLPRKVSNLSNIRSVYLSCAYFFPTIQFKLSDIGEGIAEVQIKEWYVEVGDKVSQFDKLCEVQSDKAAVTITSRYDGIVKKMQAVHHAQLVCFFSNFNVNDIVRVGQPLIDLEVPDETKEEVATTQQKKASSQSISKTCAADGSVIQFKLTDIGEGIAEVQLKEWHVKVGDAILEFDKLCEVQSDKAAVTITSRYEGIVRKLYHDIDDVVQVGQPLIDIEVARVHGDTVADIKQANGVSKPLPTAVLARREPVDHITFGKALATPAVRRIAMENKVDLKKVKGSGKDGRVLKEDVLRFLGHVEAGYLSGPIGVKALSAGLNQAGEEVLSLLAEDRIVPLRGYTRVMIKTMTEALKIPHFGYNDEVRADALMQIRLDLKDFANERKLKLSYMPFFIKAASLALTEFPSLNALIDEKLENVVYKASHNICVAMDTPGGLVVPNIKHCEQRSIFDIASELQRLQEDGMRERISREDLTDGTFTISNIGTIGGTYASPIIFPPQLAIGALGKIEKLPRYDSNNSLVPMHIFKVSWAADHRVIDGATIARFSNRWKFYVEHPSAMLAQLK